MKLSGGSGKGLILLAENSLNGLIWHKDQKSLKTIDLIWVVIVLVALNQLVKIVNLGFC